MLTLRYLLIHNILLCGYVAPLFLSNIFVRHPYFLKIFFFFQLSRRYLKVRIC